MDNYAGSPRFVNFPLLRRGFALPRLSQQCNHPINCPARVPHKPSESLSDLTTEISDALCPPSSRPRLSPYRALFAAQQGRYVPDAALQHAMLPTYKHATIPKQSYRIYAARYVGKNARYFISTAHGSYIRVYDTSESYVPSFANLTHNIRAHHVTWTITDFAVSPDSKWLAYASINAYIHLVNLQNPQEQQTVINVTGSYRSKLSIWSIKWTKDSSQVIVGSGASDLKCHGTVIVYDITSHTVTSVFAAHYDHVNSIAFLSPDNDNIIISASDDSTLKLWDRREAKHSSQHKVDRPCAVFVGHQYGLTHVSAKDDGRFFISNGKDQFIKLWDVRKPTSRSKLSTLNLSARATSFDYRNNSCPCVLRSSKAQDDSVASYTGYHETLRTLIRAHFSPMFTTGQKYIYCGSSDGCCAIYDVLTGKNVAVLTAHSDAVRDVSWHPYASYLTTGSWDGEIAIWSTHKKTAENSSHSPK